MAERQMTIPMHEAEAVLGQLEAACNGMIGDGLRRARDMMQGWIDRRNEARVVMQHELFRLTGDDDTGFITLVPHERGALLVRMEARPAALGGDKPSEIVRRVSEAGLRARFGLSMQDDGDGHAFVWVMGSEDIITIGSIATQCVPVLERLNTRLEDADLISSQVKAEEWAT